MRIDVVVQQLCAPVPGGTGRYTEGLVRGLVATASTGDVLNAVSTVQAPALADLQLPWQRLAAPPAALARLWERGWPPIAGSARSDAIHAPTLLIPGRWRARHLAVTIHDVVPWTHPETLTPRGVAFHRRMAARAARQADLIVTPTEAVASQVREMLDPSGSVVAIPPGCAPLPLPPDAPRRRHALGLPTDGYALFVGTAEPRKGLDVLVSAMVNVPDLSLVHVGPRGWGGVDVAELAARAGIAHRVLPVGTVDDATLSAVYAGATCVVMPSLAEGFGLPVIEAMAAGIPVITSDDPALVESGGGHALVVAAGEREPLAAAVRQATGPDRLRPAQLERARAHAAGFTWADFALKLRRAYSALS